MINLTVKQTGRFDVDRIVKEMKEKALSRLESDLRLLRCPVHHQEADVTRTLDGKLEIRACCQTLKDAATGRLNC